MVSAGRFRGGSFVQNDLARRKLAEDAANGTPVRDLLDEYERSEWAEQQASSLNEDLQRQQITPYWLEPIGNTGLYVTPDEPVDPTDCDRYPGSPWCGESGVDPIDLATFSPLSVTPTFTANRDGTEFCVQIETSLFAIALPSGHFCYRTPNARPFQDQPPPPPNSSPATPEDLPPRYFPVPFDYPLGACLYDVRWQIDQPQVLRASRTMGRPTGGYWVWTINGGRRWRIVFPGIGETGAPFGGGTDFFVRNPFYPDAYPRLLSIVPTPGSGSCPAIQPTPAPTPFTPVPQPQPGDRPMPCCNTGEIEEMLRLLMKRVGTEQYPATVPKNLADGEAATEKIENLTELMGWTVRQIDALTGQFPIEVEIKDADPSEEGNQTRKVKLPNIAETLAEVYALTLRSAVSGDIHTNFLMRLAAEVIATKNASLITQDYAKANASYLGYKGNTVKRKIPYSFNVKKLENLEKILQESEMNIIGWQDEDKNTVQSYLEKLMFAASIIKQVYFRPQDQAKTLIEELGNLLGIEGAEDRDKGDDTPESEDEWRAFLQEINNAQGGFNRNSPVKPEVIDPTVSGEASVDTTFTGFDLIPGPDTNSTSS